MDWINVKNKLPEISDHGGNGYSEDVLATDCKNVWCDNYHKNGFWWDKGENVRVTHWMPMPEMPEC